MAYEKDGTLPDPTSTDNPEFKIVLSIIKEGLPKNPKRWTKAAHALKGKFTLRQQCSFWCHRNDSNGTCKLPAVAVSRWVSHNTL